MARIRSIKPEIWTSTQFVDCSVSARLAFIGLWNFCDDGGVHPADPKRLKMEVFPGDDCTAADVEGWIDELIIHGLLVAYRAADARWWAVTGWKHQKIERPTFKHPSPNDQGSIVEDSPSDHPRKGGDVDVEGKGGDVKLLVSPSGDDPPEVPKPPPPKTERQKAEEAFESFWVESTKRGSKKDALRYWKAMTDIPKKNLKPEHGVETHVELFNKAFERMQVWKGSEDWTKEDGKYCPHVATWLNRQGWNEIDPGEEKRKAIATNPAFMPSKNTIYLTEDD